MTKLLKENLTLALAIACVWVMGCASRSDAGASCLYKGTMYSDGSAACQTGTQFRCDDGNWDSLGVACAGEPKVVSRTCSLGGITYSSGSASCQEGTQYRCENGSWASLGVACTMGDAPAFRVAPGGRTCMFDGATVASTSTICKSGTTFLCNDGEWINLGTLCR